MTLLARDPRAPFTLTPPILPLERRTRGYDLPLAAIALALSLSGAVLVWAATRESSGQSFLYRDLLNLAIGAGLLVATSRLNARLLRLFGPVMYVGSLLGLMLVLVAGSTINGAKAWIRIGGGFELQPAEFMKLGLIVAMAVLFTRYRDDREEDAPPTTADVLSAGALIAVPIGLILLQPDLGSAMVLGCAVFGVLIAAGVP
ncbi:MAG TPA: FtsW/RodA/SpoVE family cell cycle protein, partial [Jatrophihabitans sp.]|nr:FtsW/RodA/SpoVE family cell cycle protein [Jatrophihabitans sp.]